MTLYVDGPSSISTFNSRLGQRVWQTDLMCEHDGRCNSIHTILRIHVNHNHGVFERKVETKSLLVDSSVSAAAVAHPDLDDGVSE